MLRFPHKTMFGSCLPPVVCRGRRDRDRMVVGFTTTYVTVPITTDVVGSTPAQGEVYNIM
jgi:hypothetical protein